MSKTRKKKQPKIVKATDNVYHEEYRIIQENGKGRSKVYSMKRAVMKGDEVHTLYNPNPLCDNVSSLKWQVRQMNEAFNKPVLKWRNYKWVEAKGVKMPSAESLFEKYKD